MTSNNVRGIAVAKPASKEGIYSFFRRYNQEQAKLYNMRLCNFVVLVIGLKLWIEPVKGVCKCTAKLKGKVALVTGGNSGIGLETARDFANRGAKVVIACRDVKKSQKAVEDIIKTSGNPNVEYMQLDLSKFNSIRRFVKEFNQRYKHLHILVNNAGAAGLKIRPTEDGNEMTMQINYLGPLLLTHLLLNKIITSKPSRIINVSSYAHHFNTLDPNDISSFKPENLFYKYSNSKLCQILWTKALAKMLPDGVTINALHPGVVLTNVFYRIPPYPRMILHTVVKLLFKNPKEGAQTTIHLAVAPELEHSTGGYYSDCRISEPSKKAKDPKLIEKVFKESLRLTDSVVN